MTNISQSPPYELKTGSAKGAFLKSWRLLVPRALYQLLLIKIIVEIITNTLVSDSSIPSFSRYLRNSSRLASI